MLHRTAEAGRHLECYLALLALAKGRSAW